jgi:hypothetical protein
MDCVHLQDLCTHPLGKTAGMQWASSNLLNVLAGKIEPPTQWHQLPLCLRFFLARIAVRKPPYVTSPLEFPATTQDLFS